MRSLAAVGKQAFVALLCLSLAVWSIMPTLSHAPTVLETVQDHLEMIAVHGHSHGFEEDLYWAMHGHSHDVADHEHFQAFLSPGPQSRPVAAFRDIWVRIAPAQGASRQFRIDRPPRA